MNRSSMDIALGSSASAGGGRALFRRVRAARSPPQARGFSPGLLQASGTVPIDSDALCGLMGFRPLRVPRGARRVGPCRSPHSNCGLLAHVEEVRGAPFVATSVGIARGQRAFGALLERPRKGVPSSMALSHRNTRPRACRSY